MTDAAQTSSPAPVEATGIGPLGAKIGAVLGPALAVLMLLLEAPEGLPTPGWQTLALLVWMVVWWVTEPVPIAATSLLPMVWLPLCGIVPMAQATGAYADPIVFLFIGGFIIAVAIEHWRLHERIALAMIAAVGTRPVALVGSFALAACVLSMWISNTATTMMLVPMAVGVAQAIAHSSGHDREQAAPLTAALVLMVAYGASIGGIGTPVGSPTNLVAMGYLRKEGLDLGFAQWMIIALPLMVVMLLACWWLLSRPLRGRQSSRDVTDLLDARRRDLADQVVDALHLRHDLVHRRAGLLDQLGAVADLRDALFDQALDLLGGLRRTLREAAHL